MSALQPRDVKWKLAAGSMKCAARVFVKGHGLGDLVMDSVGNASWPAFLQNRTLGRRYNRSVDQVSWPESVESMTFGICSDKSIERVSRIRENLIRRLSASPGHRC